VFVFLLLVLSGFGEKRAKMGQNGCFLPNGAHPFPKGAMHLPNGVTHLRKGAIEMPQGGHLF